MALAPVLGSSIGDRQHGLALLKCVALPLIASQNIKTPSSHQKINSECSAIQVLSKAQLWKLIFMESSIKPLFSKCVPWATRWASPGNPSPALCACSGLCPCEDVLRRSLRTVPPCLLLKYGEGCTPPITDYDPFMRPPPVRNSSQVSMSESDSWTQVAYNHCLRHFALARRELRAQYKPAAVAVHATLFLFLNLLALSSPLFTVHKPSLF